jgi:hypothetical protein
MGNADVRQTQIEGGAAFVPGDFAVGTKVDQRAQAGRAHLAELFGRGLTGCPDARRDLAGVGDRNVLQWHRVFLDGQRDSGIAT